MSKISYIATGDANFYQLMRDQKWLAVVQFNGELNVPAQKEMLASMITAGESVVQLRAEVERLQADAELFRFLCALEDDGFCERLDVFCQGLEEPESAVEASKMIFQIAKDNGLWPIKVEPVLTEDAQADRDDFESVRDDMGGCSCHINPPCGYCTHPGNPANQEDDSCWMAAP